MTEPKRILSALLLFGVLALASFAPAVAGVEEGEALFLAGDYGPAREIFEGILADNSEDKTALYFLGRIFLAYSDLNGAKDYLEKLVKMEPENAEYHLRLGEVYGQKARTSGFFMSKKKWAGKWKKQLERAFELDPQNLDAREWLAIYLLNAPGFGGGDKDLGTEIARETIEIDEIFGRILLAYAYRRSGEIDLAISEYEVVINKDPANSRAYSGLGYAYMQKESFEAAETNFKKGVEIAPEVAESYEALAYYYTKRGDTEAMIENQEEALALDPLLSDMRYDLAESYEKLEMNKEAIHHYGQLVALTPEHHKAGSAEKRLKKLENPRQSWKPGR